jgi:hypothetical protein
MSAYTFPRLRRLHRTADMWPEWFFDVLHLATCELEAGPMRRLDGAFLFNGALPDTGFRYRSHVAAVAEACGRNGAVAEIASRRSSRQNQGNGARMQAGIAAGIYSPRAGLRIGWKSADGLARTQGSAEGSEPA